MLQIKTSDESFLKTKIRRDILLMLHSNWGKSWM